MRLKQLAALALVLFTGSCLGCPEDCQIALVFAPDQANSVCPDYYKLELRLDGGGSQQSLAGGVLPAPVVLHVVTNFQNLPRTGVSDVEIEVTVDEGGGQFTNQANGTPDRTTGRFTTDGTGRVSLTWQTGRTPGSNRLSARIISTELQGIKDAPVPIREVAGSPLQVSATGDPRPITGMSVFGGQDQIAPAGSAVPTAPAVQVTDPLGAATGVPVTFTVDLGGGSVGETVVQTDAQGVAAVSSWILGAVAGPNRLRAEAGGSTVHISATGVAGNPVVMSKLAGDAQTVAPTGSGLVTLPFAPRVRLADQFGNPVPDVFVHFELGPGAGGVNSPGHTTDAEGEAGPAFWQVGSQAGQYTIVATAPQAAAGTIVGEPATFTATVLPQHGPPATMTAVAGGGQTVGVGQPVPILPAVRVADAEDRPVPGVVIAYSAGNGSGTISGAVPVTDANGVATLGGWVLGPAAGIQYVIAMPPAGSGIAPPNLAIQVTALPAAPTALVKIAGDNQTAVTTTPVFTRPTVMVRDQHGNGVPGVTVVFAVTSGGGSLTGATQTTDALGRASVGSWTLGITPGPNTLAATVPPPVGATMATSSVSFAAQAVLDVRGVARPGADRSR